MKKLRLFALFFPLLILAVACGTTTEPPETTTPSPTVCTITLQAGIGSLERSTLVAASQTELTLPVPTAPTPVWSFVGWISDAKTTPTQSILVTQDTTLQAVWQKRDGGDFTFLADAQSVTLLTWCGTETTVAVPDTLCGLPVTALGESLFAQTPITAVSIPDSVTTIGASAFANCTALTQVFLPKTLTTLPAQAFRGCTALQTLALPQTLTTLGDGCFWNCVSLTKLALPTGLQTVGAFAFSGCTGLTELSFGANITVLADGVANGCTGLRTLYLPQNLQSIGDYAFAGSALTELTFPKGLHTIGAFAFSGCKSLTAASLPTTLRVLGDGGFAYCTNLATITLSPGLQTIGENALYGCSALTELVFPDTLTAIGAHALGGCTGLRALTIPFIGKTPLDSATFSYLFDQNDIPLCNYISDANGGFYLPASLTNITVTGTRLAEAVFAGCFTIQSVTLSGDLQILPARAFADCRSLLQISLPDTLTVISEKAFANCAMLSTICLPRSLGVLSQNAFDGCYRLVTLYTDSYLATTLTGTHPMFANVLQFYITESVGNILPATLPVGYTKATVQDVLLYVKYIKS